MTGPIRLAVDAENLLRDRRGMGRTTRAVLRALMRDARFALTLIGPRDLRPTADEFGAALRPASSLREAAFDVAWYPFNGMRTASRAPALVTVHDLFAFSDAPSGATARRRVQAPIERAVATAARIAAVSRFTHDALRLRFGVAEDRLAIVAPTPDPFFTPGDGAALLPRELRERRFVLVVGAAERRKNMAFFFEAARLALAGRAERLVVVGPLAAEDEARLRATRLVVERPQADDALLRALYREAALVAVPSRAEGFGMIAAEAMACGAAVVAADATALSETVGEGGLLIDPRDVLAWKGGLRAVLDDDALAQRLRTAGAARYAFAPRDRFARGTIAALRAIASQAQSLRAASPTAFEARSAKSPAL